MQNLEQNITQYSIAVDELRLRQDIQDVKSTNGVFIWKIPDIKRYRDALDRKTISLYSSVFWKKLRLKAKGPSTVQPPQSSTDVDFTLKNIMLEIRSVVWEWPLLLLYLGVPKHEIDRIRRDFNGDTDSQKMEAIDWWMKNIKTASWELLHDAIKTALKDSNTHDGAGFLSSIKDGVIKFWRVTKSYTAEKLKSAVESILKIPLSLIFKKRYKTRKQDGEKIVRCWIEARGSEEDLAVLESMQQGIERQLGCSLVV